MKQKADLRRAKVRVWLGTICSKIPNVITCSCVKNKESVDIYGAILYVLCVLMIALDCLKELLVPI
jgi:hypothetical protein